MKASKVFAGSVVLIPTAPAVIIAYMGIFGATVRENALYAIPMAMLGLFIFAGCHIEGVWDE